MTKWAFFNSNVVPTATRMSILTGTRMNCVWLVHGVIWLGPGVREQTEPGCVFGEPVAVCFQRGSLIRASSCQRFVSALRPSLWSCQMGKMNTFKPICTETIHHVYYQLSFTRTHKLPLFSLSHNIYWSHISRPDITLPFRFKCHMQWYEDAWRTSGTFWIIHFL